MTAEVAVLNKSAVALAADSAVTISRGGMNEKTFIVNKLFTLSKHHPVGVMVFDNAELCGVPWETIIKLYRRHLGRRSFDTLEEYAEDLAQYVSNSRQLFPVERQRAVFQQATWVAFVGIQDVVQKTVEATTSNNSRITKKKVLQITEGAILKQHDWLMGQPRADDVTNEFVARLAKSEARVIAEVIKNVFPGLSLSRKATGHLKTIAVEMFVRNSPFGQTGVVVAGFGEMQIYPKVVTFHALAVVQNRLIRRADKRSTYCRAEADVSSLDNYAAVIPFAQTDVVRTFIHGVSPEFRFLVRQQLKDLLGSYPELVAAKLGITEKSRVEGLKQTLSQHADEAVRHIMDRLQNAIVQDQERPLLEVMANLPKDELANLANALVELTSVKRKVSRGLATVGGPVDVALISKGDGFIWISRKHYFKPELNIPFTSGYFEDTNCEHKTKSDKQTSRTGRR